MAKIADREAGIELGAEKTEFLVSRLSKLMDSAGINSFDALCDLLEQGGSNQLVRSFVEAITTHTTSFFRERGHFDWLWSEGFSELWNAGAGKSRDLVIWSAASSTGQELYSAMICAQRAAMDFSGFRYRGIGTDISSKVVAQARLGVYTKPDIVGIPQELRSQCLLSSRSEDDRYRIVPNLRDRTDWRLASLTKASSLANIDADIAFLRNVLIYFDEDTQVAVTRNVLSRLRPGGILLTGHSETAHARSLGLTVIKPTIYRKER
ncbi:MAG: protein-glutamate O-methyltransferase CheR [Paracoccaceae bacterium]